MKLKTVSIKELEMAAKAHYGDGAELEFIEPYICLPLNGGMMEEVHSFDGAVAVIFHKQSTPYSPEKDTIDLVKEAQDRGELVVFIHEPDNMFMGADTTKRSWDRVCTKYAPNIFIIPHLDVSSVAKQEVDVRALKSCSDSRELKRILKTIELSRDGDIQPAQ